jgi:hypothetical protein
VTETPKSHMFVKAHELPYLSRVPDDGRSIVINPYYDTDARCFYVYSPQPGGAIFVFQPIDYIEGTYIAKGAANSLLDRRLPFSETITQHFSFRDVFYALTDAEQDLINGLCSLHKYFVLLDYANENNDLSDRLMMSTEVEYAFGNHRAFYDCLHRIICIVHKHYQPKSSEPPDSFAKIETKIDQDLATKYLFPKPLVDFYKARRDTFLKLRDIRDNIFHHGHSPDIIYKFRDGFAIGIDDRLAQRLGALNLWPDRLLKPNRLGSVLAIFEFLVRDMFDAMNDLGSTFISCFQDPPPPIATGYQVFLRSSVSKHLASLDEYRQEHWFDPKAVLGIKYTNGGNNG